ncbi:hypothetical protein AB0B20_28805 [Micromonospora sp. NPDC049151]|uniref:hypothetical protein n=1 Tax=Micromonospora sp. NPDC049151 TaxID=3155648 RepID=UPI0033EBA917
MAESVAGIDRSEAAAPGGPPPAGPRTVAPLVVGAVVTVVLLSRWPAATTARRWSWSPRSPGSSAPAGSPRRADVDNDENGEPIFLGRGLRRRWSRIWDTEVRHGS